MGDVWTKHWWNLGIWGLKQAKPWDFVVIILSHMQSTGRNIIFYYGSKPEKTIYTYNILQWTGRERSAHLLAPLQTKNEVGGCGVMGQHFFRTTSEVASADSKRAQLGYFQPLPMYLRDFERCFSHYLSPNISKPSWKWVKNQVRTGQWLQHLKGETLRCSTLKQPSKDRTGIHRLGIGLYQLHLSSIFFGGAININKHPINIYTHL